MVDDDSPDGSGQIADELAVETSRVHVLHRSRKAGLGVAYRAGLRYALGLGADVVIQMDADFSRPPQVLQTLLAETEDHDVVLGSRYLNGITVVNWPIQRILISYFGNWYARFVTHLLLSDATGGLRSMRRTAIEPSGFERTRSNGYAFQIELNYRLVKYQARIKEVLSFFLDRTHGTSKLTLRIGLEALWIAWWLRIAEWLGHF